MDARNAPMPKMTGQIRLGRVFGMRIGLDFSWFLIAGLITWYIYWQLTDGPDGAVASGATAWLVAAITAVAFFVCLLAHEFGHMLTARQHGIEVGGITLKVIGGMAMMRGDWNTPQTEIRIALAGPFVSFALWFVAFWTDWVFGPMMPPLVRFPVQWLAHINLILLIFNLLPGFPMDGGRVLRAILWWRSGDLLRATRTAAKVGGVFGTVLMVLGGMNILMAFSMGLGGLALLAGLPIIIGLKLQQYGQVELKQIELKQSLAGLRVRDAMRAPVAVPSWTSLAEATQRYLLPMGAAELPVEYYGKLMGTIGLRQTQTVAWPESASVTVYNVMRPLAPEDTIAPDVDLFEVFRGMATRNRASAVVIEDDRLVGLLLTRDVYNLAQMRLGAFQAAYAYGRPDGPSVRR